jgi:hypothetical protein
MSPTFHCVFPDSRGVTDNRLRTLRCGLSPAMDLAAPGIADALLRPGELTSIRFALRWIRPEAQVADSLPAATRHRERDRLLV